MMTYDIMELVQLQCSYRVKEIVDSAADLLIPDAVADGACSAVKVTVNPFIPIYLLGRFI